MFFPETISTKKLALQRQERKELQFTAMNKETICSRTTEILPTWLTRTQHINRELIAMLNERRFTTSRE
jgi:hypothetical protein